jgi:hypothetical protein
MNQAVVHSGGDTTPKRPPSPPWDDPLLRILTVGDGDLTLSLAIARAYGNNDQVLVSASTLEPCQEDLLRAYPNAVVAELQERGVPVLYGVDATRLHCSPRLAAPILPSTQEQQKQKILNEWDVILFHHPHLGLSLLKDQDEEQHARRHHVLLSHYLNSACRVLAARVDFESHTNATEENKSEHKSASGGRHLRDGGLVHVCLCGTQAETWRLVEAAQRQGLRLLRTMPTTEAFHHIWESPSPNEALALGVLDDTGCQVNDDQSLWKVYPSQPGFAAPRRYRNGKLGSRHFLGKYGYRHRRTEGQEYQGLSADMNVSGSMHYVFCRNRQIGDLHRGGGTATAATSTKTPEMLGKECPTSSQYTCTVCDLQFESLDALHQHSLAPALPEKVGTTAKTLVKQADALTLSRDIKLYDERPAEANRMDQLKTSSETPKNVAEAQEMVMVMAEKVVKKNASAPTGMSDSLRGQNPPQRKEESSFTVSSEHHGKRLRWYLRQCFPTLTKRTTDVAIQAGRVRISGTPVFDSSRILSTGDPVTLCDNEDAEQKSTFMSVITPSIPTMSAAVDIVQRIPAHSILVVWKGAGIRTRGMFAGGGGRDTLEYMISKQEGCNYTSLTHMDTGCLGLCALSKSEEIETTQCRIQHVISALVHGTVPDSWCNSPLQVRIPIQRQWKRKKRKRTDQAQQSIPLSSGTEAPSPFVSVEENFEGGDVEEGEIMDLHCTERSSNMSGDLALSTLSLRVATPSSSSLCLYLRKQGYPVVGDRFCRREYLSLKRSIRNRLKDKLCVGCFQLELSHAGGDDDNLVVVSKDIPDKFSARFWEAHSASSSSAQTADAVDSALVNTVEGD